MQNKPNLLDTQMNATFSSRKYYENKQLRIRRKNKAKTNPTKPNFTRLLPACGGVAGRKFVKNPLEFLIDFDSNQLWHKKLKQNQIISTGFF